MAKDYLESVDPMRFFELNAVRQQTFAQAPETPLPETYPVNDLAAELHPAKQYATIAKVSDRAGDCKSYTLVPDASKGTDRLAYFAAGQYVTVFLTIDDRPVTRAYSISSSPKQALEGSYELTVKLVEGGTASTYILENWTEGDSVELSGPAGAFEYVGLRDARTVVCAAGGSGITPFMSMARAISEGDEDFDMILLYGNRTADEVIFKDELDDLSAASGRIQVVHVLSDEERTGYEHGFISAELIKRYAPADEPYSLFVSGPQQMIDYEREQAEKLGLAPKYVRCDLYGEIHDATAQVGYPGGPDTVQVTVHIMDETYTITADAHDTLLQTMEKHGIAAPNRCRCGDCGFCRSLLKSGEVFTPEKLEHRRKADLDYGYIHPCCTFPLSDVEIEVPHSK